MEEQKRLITEWNIAEWKGFLSSIKKEKNVRVTTKLIDTKSNAKCLANEFADKLHIPSGGTKMPKPKTKVEMKNKPIRENFELDTESEQSDSDQSFRKLSGASGQFPERNKDETVENPQDTEINTSYVPKSENDGERKKHGEEESLERDTESEQSDSDQSFRKLSGASGQFPQGNNDENEEDDSSFSKDTPVDKIVVMQKNVQIPRARTRHKNQKRQIKSPTDRPCSSWTVLNIGEYFDFQTTVRKMRIPTDVIGDDQETMSHLKHTLRALQPDNLECNQDNPEHSEEIGSTIKSITVTECGTRMVIDALLIPLCLSLGLKIEVDKNINCTYLPNCRFDYCISKEGKIIGCVEAKSITSLNANSVAQALLELLILQTNLIQIDARHIKCPVFAIVTDGHRFIYIQLLGLDLKFEHKEEKVEIHEIVHEEDVYLILHQISYLIKEGTAAMGSKSTYNIV